MQHWDLSPDTQPSGQDGPFVLFSTPEARGIVIALAQGRQLGEHRVRERSIVCVLDGSVELTAGGKTLAGYSGTVTTFGPSEAHAIRALEDSRLLVVLAPWPARGPALESDDATALPTHATWPRADVAEG